MRIAFAYGLLLLALPLARQDGGSIAGTVSRADTGAAVAFAPLLLRGGTGTEFSTQTDASGQFLVGNLPAGVYRIFLDGGKSTDEEPPRAAGTVVVRDSGEIATLSLRLPAQGTIFGRLTDGEDAPVAGATVRACRLSTDLLGQRECGDRIASTISDDNGTYRITGLAPGQYYLSARTEQRLNDIPFDTTATVSPMTYYPGVADVAVAAPILLLPGYEVPADIPIVHEERFVVSGNIQSVVPGMESLPETIVALARSEAWAPAGSRQRAAVLRLPEGSDGNFELRGLVPGSYELMTSWEIPGDVPLDHETHVVNRTPFVVRDADVPDLTVLIRPGVEVVGRVRVEGPPARVTFNRNAPPDLAPGTVGIGRTQIVTADDEISINVLLESEDGMANQRWFSYDGNTFTFHNVSEGEYQVRFGLGRGFPVEVRQGLNGRDDGVIVVGPNGAEIELVMRAEGARIQGRLTNLGLRETAVVVLVPQGADRLKPYLYRDTYVEGSRTRPFQLSKVPAGEYRVFAWLDRAGGVPYMDPTFLAAYEAFGIPVTIEDSLSQVNLPDIEVIR